MFTADNAWKEIGDLRGASRKPDTPIYLAALVARVRAEEEAMWTHFGSEALGQTDQLAAAIAYLGCAASEGGVAISDVFHLLLEAETGVTVSARIRINTPPASGAFQELLKFSVQGADYTSTSRIDLALRGDGTATDIFAGLRTTDTLGREIRSRYYAATIQTTRNVVFAQSRTPNTSPTNCPIGAQDAGGSSFFHGEMDEVPVYSWALGAGRTEDLREDMRVLGLWRLNDGSGTTAADISGNDNDGTDDCGDFGDLESGALSLKGTAINGRNGSTESIQTNIGNGSESYLATPLASWTGGPDTTWLSRGEGEMSATSRSLALTGAAEIGRFSYDTLYILSQPLLLVADNETGDCSTRVSEPTIATSKGTATTTTSFAGFAEAVTSLKISPQVSPDGYINLKITQNFEEFTGSTQAAGVPPPKVSNSVTSIVTFPNRSTEIQRRVIIPAEWAPHLS